MQWHTLYLLQVSGIKAAQLQAQSSGTVLTKLVISEQLLHHLRQGPSHPLGCWGL